MQVCPLVSSCKSIFLLDGSSRSSVSRLSLTKHQHHELCVSDVFIYRRFQTDKCVSISQTTTARPSGSGQMEGERNISLLRWTVSPFWHSSITSSVLSFLNLRIPIRNVQAPSWLSFRPPDNFLSTGRNVYWWFLLYFSHTWLEVYGKSGMAQQRSCQKADLSVGGLLGPACPLWCLQAAWMATENTDTRRQTHKPPLLPSVTLTRKKNISTWWIKLERFLLLLDEVCV